MGGKQGRIILQSRYGDMRYLDRVSATTFRFHGPCHYIRRDKRGMVDLDGGPCLIPGTPLHLVGVDDPTLSGQVITRIVKDPKMPHPATRNYFSYLITTNNAIN